MMEAEHRELQVGFHARRTRCGTTKMSDDRGSSAKCVFWIK